MSSVDRAGQVLAGRYRLLRPLAAGSSGRTYVAHDLRLGRRVAVKILHDGLAGDAAFLERFRAEAQVVASLNHPNIVTLHDWGEEPLAFMVFELLTGGSLAALLARGGRLSPEQTVRVGNQVVAALAHAHEQGLVHRDVKPGNLLFDDRGTVKVADFGLARALAESGATEPVASGAGGLVGTARYAAPEQGTTEALDGRSDLYSLALVLVECVTGQVPLLGETPMATLAARAQQPVEAPVELGALGVVVERAGLPYPRERYVDAPAMGQALAAAATMLPDPQPLELPGIGGDLDEAEPTELAAAPPVVAPTVHRPAAPTGPGEAAGPGGPGGPGEAGGPGGPGEAATGTEPGRTSESGAGAPPVPRVPLRPGRFVPWVVGVLALLGVVAGGFAWAQAGGLPAHVPNLVGSSEESARIALGDAGLHVEVSDRVHAPEPEGTVISQDPTPGEPLTEGSAVTLVVSLGAAPVPVPEVVGTEEVEATALLVEAGFEVDAERRFDDAVGAGLVISQEPSAGEASPGTVVSIVVSDGPKPVVVPNVVGKPADDARAALRDAGFEVTAAEEFSDTVERGLVIRHDPVAGAEALPGTSITIIVSKGPDRVMIPDVRGLTVEEATREIERVGLKADVVGYSPGALVKRQDPEGGLMLERGRTVTLFM